MISETTLEKLEFIKVLELISRYTNTQNGKDIIMSLRPFDDISDVIRTGNYVTEAKEILIKNDYPPLTFISNLDEDLSIAAIKGTVLNEKRIREILTLVETSRKLYQFLKNKEEAVTLSNDICGELYIDKVLEHHIRSIFTETGDISDNASPKLREIRIEIREKSDALRKVVTRILRELSSSYLVQEEYITQRDGRIVVPVKAEHKRHVRGFIHSESATGQTVYIEPEETLELNNDILSLSFAEKREIEKILRVLTEKIGEVHIELKRSLRAIAQLDSIFARAKYSFEVLGAFPSFENKKAFQLIDGRHPMLIKKLGRDKTVPLNLKIDKNNVVLITGPNAGGKTVVLKTTGILILMAHCGIHIPADPDSNLHFIKKILVDIGDQQSIEDDLSTFSSHLSNIKSIIENADSDSLVLLDEIGTGTDPAEGSAIAAATLIELKNLNSTVLATTHHGNLKIIANSTEGFENASMEFDTVNLIPTYRFLQGLPGSSYAFEVAARIGVTDDFIKLAKQYLDTDKSKIEEFLVDLENKSKHLQSQLANMERENIRLSGLTNLYQTKIDKLEKEKKEIIGAAKEKAEVYLSDVNKQVESAIKAIKESNADKVTIKEVKQQLNDLKTKNKESAIKDERREAALNKKFEVGDYASLKETTAAGTVLEIDYNKNKAILNVGNLKMQVKVTDLVPARKSDTEIESGSTYDYIAQPASYRLDIRGKRPEEAEFEITRFIDDSYSAGLQQVEILHGKGTGALKKTVQELLKKHSAVKNYYYAKIEFGGEGITIVELK